MEAVPSEALHSAGRGGGEQVSPAQVRSGQKTTADRETTGQRPEVGWVPIEVMLSRALNHTNRPGSRTWLHTPCWPRLPTSDRTSNRFSLHCISRL